MRKLLFLVVLFAVGSSARCSDITTVNPLLSTSWGQRSQYALFSPFHDRLGCWATALGQIAYFWRVKPTGMVNYTTHRHHYHIQQNLTRPFNFSLFLSQSPVNPQNPSTIEVARYLFFMSITIEKDYGTGSYDLGHTERAAALTKHWGLPARWDWQFPNTNDSWTDIRKSLELGMPVMLHIHRLSGGYHAVAVDGYRVDNETKQGAFVHLNVGHERWPSDNTWYNYFDAIVIHCPDSSDPTCLESYDDNSYRRVMFINPPLGVVSN
eukprot:TRINITY_DN67615_c9_g3_i1.p1 TRINITY_DN67615_c9_g3~~TRINITY_DN67615_c9_g3_i1.p1  ORF type:complete len:266 (+),score=-0.74 TRINITY_DN67615_c9_g3_i1:3-800(+)